jgi:hypothetical protein
MYTIAVVRPLGELAIAYDEGRLVGVLTGTGGISGMVQDIIRAGAKEAGACVVYDGDPVGASWGSRPSS